MRAGKPGAAMKAYAAGVGAILCWASLAVAVGQSLESLTPEQVLFHGLWIAGVALSLWHWLERGKPLPAWPGWRVALLGVYGIWGFHTLLVLAFSLAPHVEANILNYTWPLWIVLLGALLPGHRLRLSMMAGAALGFGGVVMVIGGERLLGSGVGMDFSGHRTGLALALAAGFCWGSFSVLLRRTGAANEPTMGLFCLLSAAAAGVVLLLNGGPILPAPGQWPVLLYLGVVPLGLSFLLWRIALQGAHMQVLGVLSFFTPLLSTLLLVLISGQSVGTPLLAGLALITGGSVVAGMGEYRRHGLQDTRA